MFPHMSWALGSVSLPLQCLGPLLIQVVELNFQDSDFHSTVASPSRSGGWYVRLCRSQLSFVLESTSLDLLRNVTVRLALRSPISRC